MRFSTLDWIFLILIVIGGINWGLVGLLGFDVIAALFGNMSGAARTIYAIVGIASLYLIIESITKRKTV